MTKHIQKTKSNQINQPKDLQSLILHFPPCKPINPPTIDIAFSTKPLLIRTTEAVIYSVRTLEYALSPNGLLRQWLKLNCLIMLLVGIPAITITPIVVYLTSQFAVVSHEINLVIQNLFQAFVPLTIIIAVITFIIVFIRR